MRARRLGVHPGGRPCALFASQIFSKIHFSIGYLIA